MVTCTQWIRSGKTAATRNYNNTYKSQIGYRPSFQSTTFRERERRKKKKGKTLSFYYSFYQLILIFVHALYLTLIQITWNSFHVAPTFSCSSLLNSLHLYRSPLPPCFDISVQSPACLLYVEFYYFNQFPVAWENLRD